MEVKVVGRETITPSRPTPTYLRRHRLSFLDQLDAPMPITLIGFYAPAEKTSASLLKESLSEALSLFYPLAGRTVGNLYVDCNDQGIPFVESRASCRMSDILGNPVCSNFEPFLPISVREEMKVLAAVQFNVFDCGGTSIGLCISHKVADGSSAFEFALCWSAIGKSISNRKKINLNLVAPRLVADQFFPQMNPVELDLSRECVENVVMKPFEYTDSSIADIRARYFPGARLTRIEVLMEFLLRRHFQTMLKISHDKDSLKYMVSYVINLRPRIMPPLMVRAFGNMVGIFHFRVEMSSSSGDAVGEFKVVHHVRSVTSGPNVEKHMLRFQDRESQLEYLEERFDRLEEMSKGGSEQIVPLFFASQSKFSTYEVDFGWGKPELVSTVGTVRVNHVLFLDSKDGKGIQALVGLKEEVMALFEKDEEIMAYAKSPLAKSRDMDMERQRPRM